MDMTVLAPPVAPEAPRPRRIAGLVAHLGWEAILLVLAVAAAVAVVAQSSIDAFGRGFWLNLAATGLLASGFAFSLRTRSPNLAVAAQAMLAGIIYVKLAVADWPGLIAAIVAVLLVAFFGLILGAIAGLTSAPGWAISLGGLGIAEAISLGITGSQSLALPGARIATVWTGTVWAVVFILGSLAGAVLFLVPAVRRLLGADIAGTGFQPSRLIRAILGFGVSSLLAAISGVVLIGYVGAAFAGSDGGRLLAAAAIALLGGVSATTGRGGIAGTVVATALLVLGNMAINLAGSSAWVAYYLPAAIAIVIGVIVGWGLDKIAGPELPAA